MKFYADLHIHSAYSRATSERLTLEELQTWGRIKGIQVIGTGDCLHPAWLSECSKKLVGDDSGLFTLAAGPAHETRNPPAASCSGTVRFMPTVEISNIYKKSGRVRKVHNLICLPSFRSAEKMVTRLERIGNLKSDGRPILGLDSRDLLEIVLETDPLGMLIPAHIWTPWFSALGSKSGFDSIQECYGDLSEHIHAVETGLSSDPSMNRRLSSLDPFALVSFSDAHSPAKLGRECTIFDTDCTYPAIHRAISGRNDAGLAGTIEFFPEEGKYHYDGHRNCSVRFMPRETIEHKGICPVCGKPLTVGVMSRVEELADRADGAAAPRSKPYKRLIPLSEIIAESLGTGPAGKTVARTYQTLVQTMGNEFSILIESSIGDIARAAGELLAEGVRRARDGQVAISPGYDGEFGTVKLFTGEERKAIAGQTSLFGFAAAPKDRPPKKLTRKKLPYESDSSAGLSPVTLAEPAPGYTAGTAPLGQTGISSDGNDAQMRAIVHDAPYLLIAAGPGTGKTHTLTRRIARLARDLSGPQKCLALTFTAKAAAEMRERLDGFGKDVSSRVFAGTFHAFCCALLRANAEACGLTPSFEITAPEDIDGIAKQAWPDASAAKRRELLDEIARIKAGPTRDLPDFVLHYDTILRSRGFVDFDTILQTCYGLFRGRSEILDAVRDEYPFVFVDEYQDINAIQHAIVAKLAGNHGCLTAIGDPHQAIYGFRGADVGFFDSFTEDFPGASVLALTVNYRTVPRILSAFGQVIGRSGRNDAKPLTAALRGEGRLVMHAAPTEKAEAEYVVHEIEKLVGGVSMFSRDSGRVGDEHDGARSFGEIAVLYRINGLRRDLEEAFDRSGIPFTVSGEKPPFARSPAAELFSLLRFSAGEKCTVDSICGLLERSVKSFTGECSLLLYANSKKESRHFDIQETGEALSAAALPPATARDCASFLSAAHAAGDTLASAGIIQALSICFSLLPVKDGDAASPEWRETRDRIDRIARSSPSYREFMDAVLLQREEDGIGNRAEAVSLMTLHASKGLEWPAVFIVGCENGILPLEKERGKVDGDEERRLFYVGMSRAKEILYLTHSRRRFLHGEIREYRPSPFLADIDESLKCYDLAERFSKNRDTPDAEQLSLF